MYRFHSSNLANKNSPFKPQADQWYDLDKVLSFPLQDAYHRRPVFRTHSCSILNILAQVKEGQTSLK